MSCADDDLPGEGAVLVALPPGSSNSKLYSSRRTGSCWNNILLVGKPMEDHELWSSAKTGGRTAMAIDPVTVYRDAHYVVDFKHVMLPCRVTCRTSMKCKRISGSALIWHRCRAKPM